MAEAGGGYGAGGLRRNGLFSPGGRGGTGVAVGDADVIPGLGMKKKQEVQQYCLSMFFFGYFGRLICTVGHQSIFMFITKAVDKLSFLCFTLLSSTLGQLNSIFPLKSSLISCCLNRLLTSTDFGFP